MISKNNTVFHVLYKFVVNSKGVLFTVKNMELSHCQNIEDLMWFLGTLRTIVFVVSFYVSCQFSIFLSITVCFLICVFLILFSALDSNKSTYIRPYQYIPLHSVAEYTSK